MDKTSSNSSVHPPPSRPSVAVRVTQVIGLTSTAYAAGAIGGISLMTIPALLPLSTSSPNIAAQQWKILFDLGKVLMPSLAVIGASCFAWLGYREKSRTSWKKPFYITAAVIAPSIAPFTILFMSKTNNALTERAVAGVVTAAAGSTTTTTTTTTAFALLEKWARLNLVRSAILLVSVALAGYAIFGGDEVEKEGE